MAKNSALARMVKAQADLIRAQYERQRREDFAFCEQWYADLSQIAAAEAFEAGPEEIRRFVEALERIRAEYIDIWNADSDECEYTMVKADQRLQEVCGEYFLPHEDRYGNLKPLRESRKDETV